MSRTTDTIRKLAHMFGASTPEERASMSREELLAASIALLVTAGAKRWGETTHDSLIFEGGTLDHEDEAALLGAGWRRGGTYWEHT